MQKLAVAAGRVPRAVCFVGTAIAGGVVTWLATRRRYDNISAADLVSDYNSELMASSDVRALMRAVPQDPQDESIYFGVVQDRVRAAAAKLDDAGNARRRLIAYFNRLYFSGLDALPPTFWWEMHTRLSKALAVSMVLEGDNLRSFGAGVVPDESDIPQALTHVAKKLNSMRGSWTFWYLRHKYLMYDTRKAQPWTDLYLRASPE